MSIEVLNQRLESLLSKEEKLFIPYVMAGDGGLKKTQQLLRHLEEAGASLIEIGVPFSDPIADGPSIQAAGQRALDGGITLEIILDFLENHPSALGIPRIIMTYLNPLIQYGLEGFFERLVTAGISGVIIPDLPMESYEMISAYTNKYQIAIIPLVAPSTSVDRMDKMLEHTQGFIYAVTVNGTTGARQTFDVSLLKRLEEIKRHTGRPVLAGFGVSTEEHIKTLTNYCDGVVVGSQIVDWANKGDFQAIKKLIQYKNKL